jgi:hypothetical protein
MKKEDIYVFCHSSKNAIRLFVITDTIADSFVIPEQRKFRKGFSGLSAPF